MRKTGVAALMLALLAAGALTGCFGKNDEGDGGSTPAPTTPTDDDTTPPTDDGTTDANETEPENPTPPANETPSEPVAQTFKFAVSAGTNTGQEGEPVPGIGSAKFVVPAEGWTSFTIAINATGNGPNGEPPADGIEISVADATGAEACQGHIAVAPGAPGAGEVSCSAGAPGEWTITVRPTTVTGGFEVEATVLITY